MDIVEMRQASMMAAARTIATDQYCTTLEDINHICANYGIPLQDMTDDEVKEFFRLINEYWR